MCPIGTNETDSWKVISSTDGSTLEQCDFLVKLKVDFMGDVLKSNVRGYQVTRARRKSYRGKTM